MTRLASGPTGENERVGSIQTGLKTPPTGATEAAQP